MEALYAALRKIEEGCKELHVASEYIDDPIEAGTIRATAATICSVAEGVREENRKRLPPNGRKRLKVIK